MAVDGRGLGYGLLGGLLAGLAIGFLFAPKSGKETRKLIRDKSGEYVDQAKDVIDSMKGRTSQIIQAFRETSETKA